MKKHEVESFLKSFSLFFSSLGLFLVLISYQDYKKTMGDFDQNIFTLMRLCSFDLECPDFKIDFRVKKDKKPLLLYKEEGDLEAYFVLPDSKKYYLTIIYPAQQYKLAKYAVIKKAVVKFIFYLLLIALMSVLFSWYALSPMKKAIVTIEEFIKDILHDFNTPMSSIILNSSLLEGDGKNKENISRIQQSAHRILRLEENMKAYLGGLKTQKESFDVYALLEQEQQCLQKVYPKIHWQLERKTLRLYANKNAFSRIVANILENAAKYNKADGSIHIMIDTKEKSLTIRDTGRGIKDPKMIFERFYSENERGTGIGLHIVKKLAKELHILIDVKSVMGQGSVFKLDLKTLTKR